ncbi:hypothetical protein JST97_21695 [bacterium]|nr:hypothetical protein [bacterium]
MISRLNGVHPTSPRQASRPKRCLESPNHPVDAFQPTAATSTRNQGLSWLGKGIAVALMTGLALAGSPALAAGLPNRGEMMSASGQLHPEIQPGGVKFDKSPNQVRQEISNSLTLDQIPPGQPAYRAADSQQSGKRYYHPDLEREIARARESGSLTPSALAELMSRYESRDGGRNVNVGNSFRYCVAMNSANSTCASALSNQISYKLLSCQYRNAQGKLETVLHRSYEHQYTHNMQRGVCGGNRLESQMVDGFNQWLPVQVSPGGAPLYLNPAHIVATLPGG